MEGSGRLANTQNGKSRTAGEIGPRSGRSERDI